MFAIGNTVSADPAPNPIAVRPAANPRRSGNHLSALPTHAPYTAPAPMPPTTGPRYRTDSEPAMELITHDSATRIPAATPTKRGPIRSTRYPSIGTSQVSTRTKIVNVTWIADRLHPRVSWIGLTNKVQPYCRLAIIDMQTTPRLSCHQRPSRIATALSLEIDAASVMAWLSEGSWWRQAYNAVRRLARTSTRS